MKNYKDVANSVFQRSDEIIADNRKRKKKLMSVGIPIMCCILVAAVSFGANWKEFVTNDPTNIIEPTGTDAPTEDPDIDTTQGGDGEGEGIGGEGYFEYERAYRWSLYTTSSLYDYIMENYDSDFPSWVEDTEGRGITKKYGVASPEYIPTTIQIVRKYDLPKEVFERLNSEMLAIYETYDPNPYDICYTQEEIDAIYSDDPNIIATVLSTKYAIISNGKAFAPRFYLTASEDELNKYGITEKQIEEKIEVLREDKIITIKDGELMLLYGEDYAAPLY